MELNRDNHELQRPRNYEEEIGRLEKRCYCLEEDNIRLRGENEMLKDCIVKMSIARYVMNGT